MRNMVSHIVVFVLGCLVSWTSAIKVTTCIHGIDMFGVTKVEINPDPVRTRRILHLKVVGMPLKEIKDGILHVKITDPHGDVMHLPDVDMCDFTQCPLPAFTKYKYFDEIPIIAASSGMYTVQARITETSTGHLLTCIQAKVEVVQGMPFPY